MRKKLLTIVSTLFVYAIPVFCIVNGQPLTEVLKDLRSELKMAVEQSVEEQELFEKDYDLQHQRMVDVITASNELSLLLYTQEQHMTFDLAYALEKVSSAYEDFSKDRKPYDRIVHELDVEVDRYARLIEALRRLPPIMTEIEIEILPDSLMYHVDSLDKQYFDLASNLEKEVIRIAIKDSLSSPFVLDEEGEIHRDSCIAYASELLRQHASNRDSMIADSTHYQAAYWRMKEAYDYAQSRYKELEKYVFVDGQTSFMAFLADPKGSWEKVKVALHNQYDFSELSSDDVQPADSVAVSSSIEEEIIREEDADLFTGLSSKGANAMLVLVTIIQLVALIIFWALAFLIIWLLSRIPKMKRFLPKRNLPVFSVLFGTILYYLVLGISVSGDTNEYIQLGAKHINTFLWLLIVISGSLLLRVKPAQMWNCLRLYIPTIIIALIIIVCRITFVPDNLLVVLFPPILAIVVVRQLFFCIRESGKAMPIDNILGWISLSIYIIAFVFAFLGYTFVALLILIWWYFQLTVLLTIVCISDLMGRYKERWLDKRVDAMRNRITYVAGADRESLLFGATWFYDFIRQVAIPTLFVISLPFCVHMSLDIFDFEDLFDKIFNVPFIRLVDKEGFETLRISGRSIVGLLVLFFFLRYINRAVHAIWQYVRYATFMRKHNRTSIRNNEINLSLGNSIISVLIWMSYAIAVVAVLRIPTGSLGMVAGGLSAGIGLALKDILNNFIYGIQLMGGRLRVGDWIECDGVRGQVVAINYQCVVVETLDGTEMSFLNASLFGKNFNNLTRNNSYEFTKIVVGVAYGTDVKKVRQVLVDAMQQMRTKDKYGREIVDPQYGVYVVVNDMSDSSVDIAVKQYVLVAERIGYIDRSKEVIYEALNDAGITIPFPQCDVHLIHDDQ
jgi:small-conductance mechanosensitive channel